MSHISGQVGRTGAQLGVAAVATLLSTAVLASGPVVTPASARSCSPPDYPGSGYFTSLRVTGVSCATGRRVALAHYRCRTRTGRRGRCHRRVLRYRCGEHRVAIPTEFNSVVRCRRGSRRVTFSYQQNL